MSSLMQDAPILVVDDKTQNLYSFRKTLENAGFSVVTCTSGAEALLYLLHNTVSLVLLDVQMPEMNGFEVARIIRQKESLADLPILFITAVRNTEEFVRQGYAVGCYDYISKPVDADVLVNKVRIFQRLYIQKVVQEERNRTLEQRNRLLQSNKLLQQATRAKDEFLASMSHELRTPLSSILGYCDLLKEDDCSPLQQEFLDLIKDAGEVQLSLVNDILDMSKIKSGKFSISEQSFCLDDLVSDVYKSFSLRAKQAGLVFKLQNKIPPGTEIVGDPQRIRQVLTNLVNNAIKFTEQGKICLSVAQKHKSIMFKVSDTGIGIKADYIEKLFERFEQADQTNSRKFGGTGLGLAISKSLALMMGGELNVSSQYGKGSTFTLIIPHNVLEKSDGLNNTKSAIPLHKESAENTQERLIGRVLVTEDTATIKLLISLILESFGLEVDTAENGKMALEMLDAKHFNLVLMDMQMPVMDGVEATKRLRAQGNNIPVVALTANVLKTQRELFIAAGCDAFLEKPIDKAKLYKTVKKFIAGNEVRH